MKLDSTILKAALLFLLVAAAAAAPQQDKEPIIKCEAHDDCMGKNALCSGGFCTCSYGFNMVSGDCFLEEEQYFNIDDEILRSKRSPDSKKIEKLEKKLVKAQIKEAKKHGAVVVPVTHVHHVPVAHVPVAHVPLVHVSRHRRTPGAVSKLERKIVKAQVKRVAKKESKKVLTSRHKRDSHHKKIEKLERKLAKEHIKQAKKDAKKGRVGYVPVGRAPHYVAPVSYHHPVAYHPQPVYQSYGKPKSGGAFSRTVAKAKSYIG